MPKKPDKSVVQGVIEVAAVGLFKAVKLGVDAWYTGKVVGEVLIEETKAHCQDRKREADKTRLRSRVTTPQPQLEDDKDNTQGLIAFNGEYIHCLKCKSTVYIEKTAFCPSCNEYYIVVDGIPNVRCSKCAGKGIIKIAICVEPCTACNGHRVLPINTCKENPAAGRSRSASKLKMPRS